MNQGGVCFRRRLRGVGVSVSPPRGEEGARTGGGDREGGGMLARRMDSCTRCEWVRSILEVERARWLSEAEGG